MIEHDLVPFLIGKDGSKIEDLYEAMQVHEGSEDELRRRDMFYCSYNCDVTVPLGSLASPRHSVSVMRCLPSA